VTTILVMRVSSLVPRTQPGNEAREFHLVMSLLAMSLGDRFCISRN